jgi:hypothetical protein
MMYTMNAFVAAANILGSRILEINNQIITRLSLLEQAARIAKDAAPYVHPRLAQGRWAEDGKLPVTCGLINNQIKSTRRC